MEKLKLVLNKNSEKIERAMKIVEDFIAERHLIIYGGFAIDASLRMVDPALAIYEDINLVYADYDFYSPNILNDAFDLGAKLKGALSGKVDIINAQHLRTSKIMWEGENVADISFCPYPVFKRIITLDYITIHKNIVHIVAPINQAIDIHSALEMPFMNPPREVIGHRIDKDIRRFNLLWDHYLEKQKKEFKPPIDKMRKITMKKKDIFGSMVTGLMAYAYYMGDDAKFKSTADSLELEINDMGSMTFVGEVMVTEFDGVQATHERLLDVFYKSHRLDMWIYLADKNIWIAEKHDNIHYINVQGVLKNLLAHYVYHGSELHLDCYFKLIERVETCVNADRMVAWPSINGPNESASLNLRMKMTSANISDRLRCRKRVLDRSDLIDVAPLLQLRPPLFTFGDGRGFNDARSRFIEWNLKKSPYFKVGETPI